MRPSCDARTPSRHSKRRRSNYDGSTGRFISADPVGFASGGANLYAYANGAPQRWRDPSGHILVLVMPWILGGGSTIAGTLAVVGEAALALIVGFGLAEAWSIHAARNNEDEIDKRNYGRFVASLTPVDQAKRPVFPEQDAAEQADSIRAEHAERLKKGVGGIDSIEGSLKEEEHRMRRPLEDPTGGGSGPGGRGSGRGSRGSGAGGRGLGGRCS